MKALSHFSATLVVILISAIVLPIPCLSQNSDIYMGKIQVYSFVLDSLYYKNEKKLTAIGREYFADLYSSKVGSNTYFRISIDGESYAVVSNPYGNKVASEYYYAAWIKKDGKYHPIPTLGYTAGSYFLALPYGKPDEITPKSVPIVAAKSQIDWQLMGKVKLIRNIRTSIYHGEEDVHYDTESAFLYAAFDGSKTKYKVSVPKYGSQYDVHESGSYNGSKIRWNHNGKRITYLPSLGQMYTHTAGSYYFNVADVSH